ncbi:stigma-specific STIG1-like protein 4 [Cryptomeria japonica]|uniref:stigma-specific STIG1-like protein 4 n=1 Tax=Cryptomeria japonica TaxID=3369 RepID=UPI0027DAAB2D|nr:stigma-specific STIG1-like protein 4 [Cryptomeria japonica]
MAAKIRLIVSVMICLLVGAITLRNAGCESIAPSSLGSHSNFLKAFYKERGRKTKAWCADDPGVCPNSANARGYSNGNWVCCSKRYCIDVSSDPLNCGSCGQACGYGLGCCGGKCTNLFNDNANCGSCFNACHQANCSFGICGYGY